MHQPLARHYSNATRLNKLPSPLSCMDSATKPLTADEVHEDCRRSMCVVRGNHQHRSIELDQGPKGQGHKSQVPTDESDGVIIKLVVLTTTTYCC